MRPPLFQLSYIPLCFLIRTPDSRISNNLFSWDKFSRIIDRLYTDSVIPTKLIAGDGFEPPFSRVWTLWDSASPSCDVHVWKNYFSTFTYWLLEEVTISPINSTYSELGYTFLRTALCFSYHQTFSLQTIGKDGFEPSRPSRLARSQLLALSE